MSGCEMASRLEELTRYLSFTDEDLTALAASAPGDFHELFLRLRETHTHLLNCPTCRRQSVTLVAFYTQAAQA